MFGDYEKIGIMKCTVKQCHCAEGEIFESPEGSSCKFQALVPMVATGTKSSKKYLHRFFLPKAVLQSN